MTLDNLHFSSQCMIFITVCHQIYVDKLVKVAYENWENVVEYDGEALIGVKPYSLQGINAATEDPGTAPNPAQSHINRLESGTSL